MGLIIIALWNIYFIGLALFSYYHFIIITISFYRFGALMQHYVPLYVSVFGVVTFIEKRGTGEYTQRNLQLCYHPLCSNICVSGKMNLVESSRRLHFLSPNRPFQSSANKKFSINCSDQLQSDYVNNAEATSALESMPPRPDSGAALLSLRDGNDFNTTLQSQPKMFRNRFLNFVRISSVLNNAAESFFKSEIRRRLFVTAVLIVISRIGYYIPLPGFDRRLIPQDYLSFVSGSVGELTLKYMHACTYSQMQTHIHINALMGFPHHAFYQTIMVSKLVLRISSL